MVLDYEEENALEWQDEAAIEAYRKQKQADADRSTWSDVAPRKNKHHKGQAANTAPPPARASQVPAGHLVQSRRRPANNATQANASNHAPNQARSGNVANVQGRPSVHTSDQANRSTQTSQGVTQESSQSLRLAQTSMSTTGQTGAERPSSGLHSRPHPARAPSTQTDSARPASGVPSRKSFAASQGFASKKNPPKKAHEGRFAKIRPDNDLYGKVAERQKREEQETKHKFSTHVGDEGEVIGNKGIFILSDQMVANPTPVQRVLEELRRGSSLTADISRERHTVELVAPDLQTVYSALARMRGVVLGSTNAQEQFQMVLVDSPGDGMTFENTKLRMLSAWDVNARPQAKGLQLPLNRSKMFPILIPVPRRNEDFENERKRLRRNALAIQVATTRALGRLLYFKGSITMRINFGALAFHRYRWIQGQQTQATETFMKNLRNSGTEAELYKLATESQLWERVQNASYLLAPYWGGKVQDTRPSITGHYVWTEGGKANRIYQIVTDPIGSNQSVAPRVRDRGWLPPNAPGLTQSLSIFLTQLNCGISAALQVFTEEQYIQPKDTPAGLTAQTTDPMRVEDYVKAAGRGELLFDWRHSNCNDFRQRTIWRWRLKVDTSYILEVVRHDSYEMNRSVLSKKPVETRWDACVYAQQWDEAFQENVKIQRGAKARWDPSIETFFPAQDTNVEGDQGVPPGFGEILQWVRDFLCALNQQERLDIWRE